MSNSAAKRIIEAYLNEKSPGYALLLDGPWGSGKTHLVKHLTEHENDPQRLYVTLHDVATAEAFDWALVRAMRPWSESAKGRWSNRIKELLSGIQLFGNSVDLTKVNLTEIVLINLPEVLIFDDLERCGLNHLQLSGLINRFVEQQKKRVILIANSENVQDKEAFDKSREKLIGRTITVTPDLDAALTAFWPRMSETQGKTLLRSRQGLIAKTFEEAEHQNLRLLLRSIQDAALVLDALEPDMLQFEASIELLTTTFIALHMAYHGGVLTKEDMRGREKYRFPSSSLDGENKDNLKLVQENHPNCHIEGAGRPILTADFGVSLIVDGYAEKTEIVSRLRSTHYFSVPSEQPDWVRLWNWADESTDDLALIIQKISGKMQNQEITDPGEILQIYAASKFLARRKAIGLNEMGIAGYFRKYINKLSSNGRISPLIPSPLGADRRYGYRDEGGRCSYGGYTFDIDKEDRKIIDLMKAAQEESFEKNMQLYASELFDEFKSDFERFLRRFDPLASGKNYTETPVVHYFNVSDVSKFFVSKFSDDREFAKEFLRLLGKRRSALRDELKVEWAWIDEFEQTAIKDARESSQLLGAQVSQYVKWFLHGS